MVKKRQSDSTFYLGTSTNAHMISVNVMFSFILKYFQQNLKNSLVPNRTIGGGTLGRPVDSWVTFGNRVTIFQQHWNSQQVAMSTGFSCSKVWPIQLRNPIWTSSTLNMWLFTHSESLFAFSCLKEAWYLSDGACPWRGWRFHHFNYDVTNSCPWHKRFVRNNRLVTVLMTFSERASWCLQNILLVENMQISTAVWHINRVIGLGHKHEVEPWFINSNFEMQPPNSQFITHLDVIAKNLVPIGAHFISDRG